MNKKRIAVGIAAATVVVSVLALSRRSSARQKLADATSRLRTTTSLLRAEPASKA